MLCIAIGDFRKLSFVQKKIKEVLASWQAFCVLISFHFVTARKSLMQHKNILNICKGQSEEKAKAIIRNLCIN